MTVVVGTAGHIDHGKTALLRALTGIDADRLPEEQRRGMTIDVGYAHLRLDDGTEVDFVDVPGHDRLIGNMLVGAGEIDAVLLVVAADDGPRPQTREHLGLLDALGIERGLAVITKTDIVTPARVREVADAVAELLRGTTLAETPVLAASAVTGAGIDAVRAEIARVAEEAPARSGPPRLAIDRVFSVRGRGTVVTGSLRGGAVARGDVLRAEPGGGEARIREIQVHNAAVDRVAEGGRVALNIAGIDADALHRGVVLTSGPGIERSDRLLVALRANDPADLRTGLPIRLHLGTEQVDGTLDQGRHASVMAIDGRRTAILRLARPIAAAFGDAFVLRRPSPGETLAGGHVLDPVPPRGISRRRATPEALQGVVAAPQGSPEAFAAIVALHGAVPVTRLAAWEALHGVDSQAAEVGANVALGPVLLAQDVHSALVEATEALVRSSGGLTVAELRAALVTELRRRATVERAIAPAVAGAVVDELVNAGRLTRSADRVLPRGSADGPSEELRGAMDRLEAMLTQPAPPPLHDAATAARCSLEGIRALEAAGRIVRVEDDLAWEAATLAGYRAAAVRFAAVGPLSPAAFRDAIGSSRRYALAILEDLDRQGVLRRTPAGHVIGSRGAAEGAAPAPR